MTDDTISRQAAVDTVERMYKACEGSLSDYHDLLVAAFMDLTPAHGDGDTISRAAAIDAVNNMIRRKFGISADLGTSALEALPPAQPGWIPCSEKMPPDYQWYYATCKSLVDNRENWVVEGCYTPWEHFNSTPMIKCGKAEVIAWMPKGFPEPWEGDTDAH